jgi:hypothetical protein
VRGLFLQGRVLRIFGIHLDSPFALGTFHTPPAPPMAAHPSAEAVGAGSYNDLAKGRRDGIVSNDSVGSNRFGRVNSDMLGQATTQMRFQP